MVKASLPGVKPEDVQITVHGDTLTIQGETKADAVAKMVEGPVSSMCPGSALKLHHDANVIVDEAAASRLTLADYYRYTFANRPAWQRFETPRG